MNQKIKTVTLALVLLAAQQGISRADTSFRWSPLASSLQNQLGVNIAVSNATVLTFISTNASVNTIASAGQLVLNSSVADDLFYSANPNRQAGRYTTDYMTESNDSLVGLYAYAVILNMPWSSYTTFEAIPRDGSVYAAVTPISSSAITKLVPAPTQSFDGGYMQTSLQVIPEPTGAGLALVGIGSLILRRRMKARRK
ncbi:MAG: hypothetical protein U1E27_13250 [Kiritimatiellia bacterium]|nr:hypothetical protein [Kiritimatiellia bacterium]